MTSFHWTLKMNFAKKIRGRKSTTTNNIIPSKLTRRDCVSNVCEIFDIIAKLTPLTAAMKLDLHELVSQKLDWDDKIPDNLPPIQESHFQMVNEIKTLKYQMAVIPEDAIDIKLETLDFGDANREIAYITIYARFRRKDDSYSCQLVFARSRLFLTEMTQPRAELQAALINTHTEKVLRRALGQHHMNAFKLTDSQIVLHWISNEKPPLKQ